MELQISDYMKQNKCDRHGWRVDFKIINKKNKKTITIYQNVRIIIKTRDLQNKVEQETWNFVEAWRYKNDKIITDSFLIPIDWRRNCEGNIKIDTVVWFEEGPFHKALKKGSDNCKWGRLHGKKYKTHNNKLKPSGYHVYRTFHASWNNLNVKNLKSFANGKDLILGETSNIHVLP